MRRPLVAAAVVALLVAGCSDPGTRPAADPEPTTQPVAVSTPAPTAPATPEAGPGTLTLTGPTEVVDGRTITLRVARRAADGAPAAGDVDLQRWTPDGGWRDVAALRTGREGRATHRVTPRVDSVWRAVAGDLRSARLEIANRPPGEPVADPRAAPEPRVALPRPARAVGAGAAPAVTPIPDAVWRDMVGVSWRPGCPVGRAGLRLVRVNFWGYDGYRYRGEVVAARRAAAPMADALAAMYRERLPVRAMFRVDRFGYSEQLDGGDDYRSMAAGNTSAFNCRDVVGRPGVRSNHSLGLSLDVNPWENPYTTPAGEVLPDAWWQPRTHPRIAWRSAEHPVVRLMAEHGLRWSYGTRDNHHFDMS